MDDQRFDNLARALAGGASRRRVLRGMLGGTAAAVMALARGSRAGAQEGTLAPGAACSSTSQCSQAGGPVSCADNGYANDGALNCCRTSGGACADATSSADCCGGLYCRNGVCTDLSVSGELPPGSYCTATSQCSQAGGPAICADNGLASDGALNCCRTAGGVCDSSAVCCSGLLCAGGVCSGNGAPAGTVQLGAACTATTDCAASTSGSVICASNEIEADGALNCCLEEGGACGSTSSLCCGSLFCVGGVCGQAAAGNLAAGAICTATSECSQDGGAAVCADNGVSGDGALNCCRLEVAVCASDAECCAGLVCGDNLIAEDGALTCCRPQASACGSDAACCGSNVCVGGVCQAA